jgi:hypothetical protein
MAQEKPVEVFAGEFIEAGMIHSMLLENKIEAFLQNEMMGSIAPWMTGSSSYQPVKVLVSSINEELAKALIQEFDAAKE